MFSRKLDIIGRSLATLVAAGAMFLASATAEAAMARPIRRAICDARYPIGLVRRGRSHWARGSVHRRSRLGSGIPPPLLAQSIGPLGLRLIEAAVHDARPLSQWRELLEMETGPPGPRSRVVC